MYARILGLALAFFAGIQTAAAADPSMDWPYYRVAMQSEALRAFLERPPELPWARELNERVGFRVKSATEADLENIQPYLELTSARLWTRLKGPPKLPVQEGKPVMRVALDTCRRTWDTVEPGMAGLHTAISNWSERPTCLLQRFGTSDGLAGAAVEHVDLSLQMVGGRLGSKGRVVGWPGEKEKGFRALYRAEGPILTLLSSQVKTPLGWAGVMRSGGGSVLLERPMRLNASGRVMEVVARLVYAKARKNGSKWLDIGRLPPPPFPKMMATFEVGSAPLASSDGPDSPSPTTCDTPEGMRSYVRGAEVRWIGEHGVFRCEAGRLVTAEPNPLPFVLIQNAGAGTGPTRRAAQVVYHAMAATHKLPAEQIEVAQDLSPIMNIDHITVYYRDDADEKLAALAVKNLHLAMPWQVVVSKKVASMPGRFTVQVGW